MNWKFVYNGSFWQVKIENEEQLAKYCELTDPTRFGNAIVEIAEHNQKEIKGHWSGIAGHIDSLSSILKQSPMQTAQGLISAEHMTYCKIFNECGVLYINRLGGCNGNKFKPLITINKSELIFPIYSRKDVKIQTYEEQERKYGVVRPNNYHYHWYATVGDTMLKDGEKFKWDTKEECENFVNSIFKK